MFAVPGSPLDPRAQGANNLIREGATLVETAADVLAVLDAVKAPLAEPADDLVRRRHAPGGRRGNARLRAQGGGRASGPSPVAVDELIRQCPFSPPVILTVLLELELAGRLERHAGNRVSVVLIEAVHPS